jgi:hypothetical protein
MNKPMNKQCSSVRSTRLRLTLLASLLAALMVVPVRATIMEYLAVGDLTRRSTDIFHGRVISTETYWNAERTHIYTRIRVRINEAFKGPLRRSETVTVTQLGGIKDGFKMDYTGRPDFSVGNSVVLFTTRGKNNDFIIVGLKQGKMQVVGDEVIRDFSGITMVRRSAGGQGLQQLTVRPERMRIAELRRQIEAAR